MSQVADSSTPEKRFQGKLARKALWLLLPVSIIPTAILGGIIFFNTSTSFSIILFLLALTILGALIWRATNYIVVPINDITKTALHFAEGDLQKRAVVDRDDEIGRLAYSFNQVADELNTLYHSLEMKVAARTQQIQTVAETAQIATSATSLDELLQPTVNLIIERFDYYHAAIYLLDDTRKHAVLRVESGNINAATTAPNFQLAIDSHSIIGWVTANNRPWVASDVSKDPYYLEIETLPETNSEAVIPLSVGDNVMGALDIQSIHLNAFSDDDIATLRTLANQIASALRNIQMLETTRIDLRATSLLYQASHTIAEADTTEDVFLALKNTIHQSPYASALFAADQSNLRGIFVTDPRGTPLDGSLPSIPVSPSEIGAALPATSPLLIANPDEALDLPNAFVDLYDQLDYKSCAFLPIIAGGNLAALLIMGATEQEPLTTTALDAYGSLVRMAATALEKVNALQTITQRLTELQILNTISQSISTETSLAQLYEIIHQQIVKVIGDVNFLIALYTPSTNMIEIPYMDDGGEIVSIPSFPLGQGLTSIIIRTRQPLMIVEDTLNRSQALGAIVTSDTPAKSWLGVPLLVGGDVIGAIVIQDIEHEYRFDEDDMRLLTTLAAQVAVAIRNARLLENTQERAERDRQLYEITSKIRGAVDMQSILATTTQELSKALGARRAKVEISVVPAAQIINGGGNNHYGEEASA